MLVELITEPTGQRRRRTLDIVCIICSSPTFSLNSLLCTVLCAVHLKAHQCEPRITRRSALKKDGKCWRLELRWLIVIDDLLSCSLFLLLFLIFHLLSTFHPPHLVIAVRFAGEQMRKGSEVHPPQKLLLQNRSPAT